MILEDWYDLNKDDPYPTLLAKNYYLHCIKNPSIDELKKLSETVCINKKRVAQWFSSERHREKNTLKKTTVATSTN